ncbi:MAG: fibronectin type III domain-containing protein, partial [Dehalococcoidales bacterium]|nr:fibronectin type III domain-containing protein [Dehalococcoidales bacterium]
WQEESSNGIDNQKADNTELSLILAHGNSIGVVGFGPGKNPTGPDPVRLGYVSPDSYGRSIWWFIIECEIFNDGYNSGWLNTLAGNHLLLGFKNSPIIGGNDFSELANRLTGTSPYQKETIQNAFSHTYVDSGDYHDDNIARIIAESTNVADNDQIDSFEIQTTVDSEKFEITYWFNDVTPPAAVTNLAGDNRTLTSLRLTWTSPGDDGNTGIATHYDIRYSTSQITEQNWSSATQVLNEPSPETAGTNQNHIVDNLSMGTTYYFAIKSSDNIPNWSSISNCPSITTWKRGDANDDSTVNSGDITKIYRIIFGLDSPTPGADANLDGVINMADVTTIEYYIL